jgi:signal transduction histidine kinase
VTTVGVLGEIVDSGPGIADDIQHRVFEPFFSANAVGDETGLGLDIAFRTVLKHHGDIRLTSVPGQTNSQVRLPAEPQTSFLSSPWSTS